MTQRIFIFRRTYAHKNIVLCEENIVVPLDQPFNWLFSNLILFSKIPKFAENDFRIALREFIEKEERSYYDERITSLYASFVTNDSTHICEHLQSSSVVDNSGSLFQPNVPTDEEIFGQAYVRIIQSSNALDLLKLEHSFAVAVETEVIERNRAINGLKKEVLKKTDILIAEGGPEIADSVSEIQRNFHSEYELLKMKLDSRISELKDIQKRDYRSFVMSFEEQLSHSYTRIDSEKTFSSSVRDHIRTSSSSTPKDRTNSGNLKAIRSKAALRSLDSISSAPRSESFMVQLGRQLRTSYNLKLIQADPLDLITAVGGGGINVSDMRTDNFAERLSSALTIYSNELTGLVILVDCQMLNSKSQKRLAAICERSTDFHFPDFDHQLAEIQEKIQTYNGGANAASMAEKRDPLSNRPFQPGDVYMTRHTNLASPIGGVAGGGGGINVVFHVVVSESGYLEREDRLRCTSPLHVALSNVLRVCFQCHITTLSLPLLFTRRTAEHMNKTECHRRAETLLKAVKGGLMELTTWRGQVLRSILFLIPPDLPDSYFDSFSHLITSSFQQLNPIISDNS